ncbi:MAG: hypothetical protein ACPG4T_17410, partial [Nannocystaceae bacterium]
GCKNSGCPGDDVCVAVWPYDDVFTEQDNGFCQQTNGHSDVGPWQPKDFEDTFDPDKDETALGLPTSWFHLHSNSGFGHETMHAAGFIHEQQRPGWEQWVQLANEDCGEYWQLQGPRRRESLRLDRADGLRIADDVRLE